MLDYWASAIAAVPGEQFPERIWLAPYQAEPNVSAANDAEWLYGALGSAEEQRIARSIFEDLSQLRDGELVRASAKTRETLRQRVGGRRFDHVLEKYVEAGVIAKIAAKRIRKYFRRSPMHPLLPLRRPAAALFIGRSGTSICGKTRRPTPMNIDRDPSKALFRRAHWWS